MLTNKDKIECPVCYGQIDYIEKDRIFKCINCKTIFKHTEQQNSEYFSSLHNAKEKRQLGEFSKANAIYNDLLTEYIDSDVDLKPIYWGKYLCDERVVLRKIKYKEEIMTLPNLYEVLGDRSKNYEKVISLCGQDNQQIEIYENQYEKIQEVKRNFKRLYNKIKPFDIFISFKAKYDTELATKIYSNFIKLGYNVFFSPVSLNKMSPNSEYTSNILYALKTAKVLLLVCSNYEYINNSNWVRDEWENFSRQMEVDKTKCIIPIITGDFEIGDLPKTLLKMQAINDNENLLTNLENMVDKTFNQDKVLNEDLKRQPKQEKTKTISKKNNQDSEQIELQRQIEELQRQNELLKQQQAKTKTQTQQTPKPVKKVYKIGDTIKFGKYGGKKIEFEIKDFIDGNALLVSKEGIEARCFDTTDFLAVPWKKCGLRKWLNFDFYNTAFSDEEKSKIQTYSVTDDKVFIFSKEECEKYFPTEESRRKKGSKHAQNNGLFVYNNGNICYWLRSERSFHYMDNVTNDGTFGSGYVRNEKTGIVPAILIKLDADEINAPLKIGDIIKFGNYNNENIEFEVKDFIDGNALIVSKKIIECRPFDSRVQKIKKFFKTEYKYNTDYDTSEIREWLNNDFYNTAFNDKEKAKIQTYPVTNDKVFLLSVEEYEKYFTSEKSRIKQGTQLAKDNGLFILEDTGWYWLRSANSIELVNHVMWDGSLSSRYPNAPIGVVPALLIKNQL